MSMVTTCAVAGSDNVADCDSRSTAHGLWSPWSTPEEKFASCTHRNGRSGTCHWRRHCWIIAGNWMRYVSASATVFAFDSPWYQITPRMAYGCSGWIIRL